MSMSNDDQIERWNTVTGQTWAELQAEIDALIQPLGLEAIDALAPSPGEHVLDIGCGCGQSSLDLAERVGAQGQVTGVDVSTPMLEVARGRSSAGVHRPVAFRRIDAQTDSLGEAGFDAAYSRFGVMFFSDPDAAFANIARALKPGGRLAFVCWRAFAENLWMREPWDAALPVLPPQAPADPTAPGPFAFADADRVRAILAAAGFAAVDIRPYDLAIGGAAIDDTLRLALRVGPLASALREAPERRDAVAAAVKARLALRLTADGVRMPAAVWIVTALRP